MRALARRDDVARIAAPVAFLLAMTVLVLLIRSGLHGSSSTPAAPLTTAPAVTQPVTKTTPKPKQKTKPPAAGAKQYYTIQRGDTFGVVASKYGISVTELEALNPGVSSNSLTIGQQIRVK